MVNNAKKYFVHLLLDLSICGALSMHLQPLQYQGH